MKRSTVFNFLMGIAMLGCVDTFAQPWQNFYIIGAPPPGTSYKPGRAHDVLYDAGAAAYVTAGMAQDNNLDAFSIAMYDPATGNNLWTNLFEPDHTLYQNCTGYSIVEVPGVGYAMAGTMYGWAGTRSVLIMTDLAGNYMWHQIVSKYEAKGLAFNSAQNELAVLTSEFGTNGPNDFDYNIQTYDIWGTWLWGNVYGTTEHDQPEGFYYDANTNSYLATGLSANTTTWDQQVLTIRVDAAGNWVWGNLHGSPNMNEVGHAIAPSVNGADYVVTGYIATAAAAEPISMELDQAAGNVNYYFRYSMPSIGHNLGYGIIQDGNGGYYVVGLNRMNNANGMLLRLTGGGIATMYSLYGQPGAPGDEILYDIAYNSNTAEFALVGDHWWSGSTWPWLIQTMNDGRSVCHKDVQVGTIAVSYTTTPASPIGPMAPQCCETITQLNTSTWFLDECLNPFKSSDGPESSGLFGSFNESVSPQPATNTITLRYELPQGNGGSWILRDVLGREIMTQSLAAGSKELSVSVSKLESGVYFYEYVVNGNIVAQNKLLIAR